MGAVLLPKVFDRHTYTSSSKKIKNLNLGDIVVVHWQKKGNGSYMEQNKNTEKKSNLNK